jgi:hypothetical protein
MRKLRPWFSAITPSESSGVAAAERGFEVVGKRPRVRLVAFDLDGTLVRGNTVCEVLAHVTSLACGRSSRLQTSAAIGSRFDSLGTRWRRTIER